jgi:hypothetical protein
MTTYAEQFCRMIADTNNQYEERECQMAWFRPLYRAKADWLFGQVVEFIDDSIATIWLIYVSHYNNMDDYVQREHFGDLAREVITKLLEKNRTERAAKAEEVAA